MIRQWWKEARWALKTKVYDFRTWVSRAVRGYAPVDWWSYYSQNSERAVVLLTLMLDKGVGGCPGGWGCKVCLAYRGRDGEVSPWDCPCKPFDRWTEALGDMIYFHTVCAKGDGLIDLNPDEQRRYRRGKYYYFRWYESLWD